MKDSNLKDKVVCDIIFLSWVGLYLIVVHGAVSEINTWLGKLNIVFT